MKAPVVFALFLLAILWLGCVSPATPATLTVRVTETVYQTVTKTVTSWVSLVPTPTTPPATLKPRVKGFKLFSAPPLKVEFKPAAPTYTLPLKEGEVENLEYVAKRFGLTPGEVDRLLKNGFLVKPAKIRDVDEFYKGLKEHPKFITTDAVLYAYHTIFQNLLMELEEERFTPALSLIHI